MVSQNDMFQRELEQYRPSWIPSKLARAALGCASVAQIATRVLQEVC